MKGSPRASCEQALSVESKAHRAESPYDWFAAIGRRYEWLGHKLPAYVAVPDEERIEQLVRLDSFKDLQHGWDSYDAEPPSEVAIASAKRVLHVIWSIGLVLSIKVISPSVEGGVGIVFTGSDQKYADVECFNDGDILAIISEGVKDPSVWAIGGEPGALRQAIEKIHAFLNA
jgi:hypothetical protein